VTFFGVATADNRVVDPDTFAGGVPVYIRPQPFGFLLILEGRRGTSNRPISNCGVRNQQGGLIVCGQSRAGVQVQANRPLGNASAVVCDLSPPNIGGVPGVNPPDFGPSQMITDILNDMACRWEDHPNEENSCTFDELGNFAFQRDATERQFCSAPSIGTELELPRGDTLFTAQIADMDGNVGNQMRLIVRIP
jgi:hypothetical protein